MVVNYPQKYTGAMDPEYTSAMSGTVFKNYYFGAPTPATKALQLPEISKLGMSGIQNVEIGVIEGRQWEAIPREHFEQMKQLAKLQLGKNAVISVHAPLDPDPTGFAENKWAEENRKFAETFFRDVIDKAQMVQVNEKVSVPVTIHASHQQAVQWAWDQKANDGKGGLVEDAIIVVDPESGQLNIAKRETVQYPTGPKEYSAERKLEMLNDTTWLNKRKEISAFQAEFMRAQEEFGKAIGQEIQTALMQIPEAERKQREHEVAERIFTDAQTHPERHSKPVQIWKMHIDAVEQDFGSAISGLFDRTKHVLEAFKNVEPVKEKREKYEEQYNKFQNLQNTFEKQMKDAHARNDRVAEARIGEEAIDETWKLIHTEKTPVFMPVENWAQQQAAKTFSDLAMYSYETYDAKGKKGPNICVENFHPNLAMGRGKSLAEGLKLARKMLVERLVAKKVPKEKAEAIAKEKIGATWDIGHINMLRRFGAPTPEGKTEEERIAKFWEQTILPEFEAIKKDIGHVHISDNFGYQDVHLAPGMGNTPIREFLAALEKEGKLGKVKAILESGGLPAHLGIPPSHTEALAYFNVPLYPGITVPGATWKELGQNYFFGGAGEGYGSGYGKFLPEGHFGEYGTGFSQLPYSLGGARGGGEQQQSRFSNTPMS